ncbi:hypothetical protein NQZ79_g1900 [Umbelopsis isabellina]|nr:hypothetical protein NQZ79_g1900 [Umbelopsis isabellina]
MELNPVLCGGADDTYREPTAGIDIVKRLMLRFVDMKLLMNPNHEFAIILLTDRAIWQHMNFTNDKLLLQMAIEEIGPVGTFNAFGMSDESTSHVDINDPNHFVQAITIYGRSNCLPSEPDVNNLTTIQTCTNFVLDMLYIHERKTEANMPQDIYDRWLQLESDLYPGWFYEFGRLARRRIALAMMQLLAHPLQRPGQDDMESQELKDIETQEDTLILLDGDD